MAARRRLAALLAVILSLGIATGSADAALRPTTLKLGLEPGALASGPAGTIWAAGVVSHLEEPDRIFVTRLAPTGRRITFSRVALPGSKVGDLIRGPGNSMWLTIPKMDQLVRVDADRDWQVVQMPEGSRPTGLAVAGDSVWVTLAGRAEIARVDRSGSKVGYPLRAGTALTGIVATPDERLWAIATDTTDLVLISLHGSATYAPITTGPEGAESKVNGSIAVGYRGAVWVSQSDHGTVERIILREDQLHLGGFYIPGGPPKAFESGPDRNVWFADRFGRIGSIAPDGEFGERHCAVPGCEQVRAIGEGPDGRLWFATDRVIAPYRPRPLALKIRNIDGGVRDAAS